MIDKEGKKKKASNYYYLKDSKNIQGNKYFYRNFEMYYKRKLKFKIKLKIGLKFNKILSWKSNE